MNGRYDVLQELLDRNIRLEKKVDELTNVVAREQTVEKMLKDALDMLASLQKVVYGIGYNMQMQNMPNMPMPNMQNMQGYVNNTVGEDVNKEESKGKGIGLTNFIED